MTEVKSPKNKGFEVLKPVGERLKKEDDHIFYQELEPQEIEAATTKKPQQSGQLNLFGDMD